MGTKIEWTEETWNPIIGCSKVSPGCDNCYAERMAKRLANMPNTLHYQAVTCPGPHQEPKGWNGKTYLVESALSKPLHWKKPRTIFICSMGDLFHETVALTSIMEVMYVINKCPQHTFLILTKRPKRMYEYFMEWVPNPFGSPFSPLSNIWIGVTAENQEAANKRIPILLQIPAAKRFVSIEPMLGAVDLKNEWIEKELQSVGGAGSAFFPSIDWVICGGESGPGARPMYPDWVRSIKKQCNKADVPFFFKQWGAWVPVDYINKEKPEACYVNLTPDGKKEILLREPRLVNLRRVGKKKAGCLLNSEEWKQIPES